MKMRSKLKYVLVAAVIALVSCHKKDQGTSGGVVAGNATLDAQVMHHWWSIPGCRVYIKNNCSSFPVNGRDTTIYESALTTDNSGYVHFGHLANGVHCLYAVGYDPQMDTTCWGYNFINIDNRPGEIKNYELTVPVSE